jgi:hypothetical protein
VRHGVWLQPDQSISDLFASMQSIFVRLMTDPKVLVALRERPDAASITGVTDLAVAWQLQRALEQMSPGLAKLEAYWRELNRQKSMSRQVSGLERLERAKLECAIRILNRTILKVSSCYLNIPLA